MSRIYHDADANLDALKGQTIAVVGYGNQGRSQALNLRDSGLDLVIGNLRDGYAAQAEADGFTVLPIEAACARADAVMLLIPDEVSDSASNGGSEEVMVKRAPTWMSPETKISPRLVPAARLATSARPALRSSRTCSPRANLWLH